MEELIAALALLIVGNEQTKGDRDILATRIRELQVDSAIRSRKLGAVMWAVRSFKCRNAAGEDKVSTLEALARNMVDMECQHRELEG